MKPGELLAAQGVTVRFRRGRGREAREHEALAAVDFGVGAGEIVGLVGESGCGKSTLARVLAGLLIPEHGTVTLGGRPVNELAGAARRRFRRSVRLIFQSPDAVLNRALRVGELLADVVRAQTDGDRAGRRRRVAELLDEVRLEPRLAERFPGELSGGQKRRVGIAVALAGAPAVLLADEPLAGLDAPVQLEILALLRRLHDERSLAVVLISHDIGAVQALCSRVVTMLGGRIVESRPRREGFSGLADTCHPYTAGLLAADRAVDQRAAAGGAGTRALGAAELAMIDALQRDTPADLVPGQGCALLQRCHRYEVLGSEAQRRRCEEEAPRLWPLAADHQVACHHVPVMATAGGAPRS
ncbi:MAG: ABC transporter ATP-binding protein [Candidatus Schekmanbacteria bacterium]|nr:ABC transporter ATP-binding protein [Candidatus Schekmanbacteria bacterium]